MWWVKFTALYTYVSVPMVTTDLDAYLGIENEVLRDPRSLLYNEERKQCRTRAWLFYVLFELLEE